jgi:hypothetical protein
LIQRAQVRQDRIIDTNESRGVLISLLVWATLAVGGFTLTRFWSRRRRR